jgi:hypothetical protein
MFDGDASLFAGSMPAWWLCDDCRRALLPRGTESTEAIAAATAVAGA